MLGELQGEISAPTSRNLKCLHRGLNGVQSRAQSKWPQQHISSRAVSLKMAPALTSVGTTRTGQGEPLLAQAWSGGRVLWVSMRSLPNP